MQEAENRSLSRRFWHLCPASLLTRPWSARCSHCARVPRSVGRGLSDPVDHLLVLDLGVVFLEQRLVLCKVVKCAVVGFGVAMLGAVDVAALADDLENADLLFAVPALVGIRLDSSLLFLGFFG